MKTRVVVLHLVLASISTVKVFCRHTIHGLRDKLFDNEVNEDSFYCGVGRHLGDKWFDGCQWCLCSQDGPFCSSSSCPDLVNKVPPCDRLHSSWWDGCYNCMCLPRGIECQVSPVCLKEFHSKTEQTTFAEFASLGQFEQFGQCRHSHDGLCICGLDGLPSCSADIIDRHAFDSTTIALAAKTSKQYSPKSVPFQLKLYNKNMQKGTKTKRRHKYFKNKKVYKLKDIVELKRTLEETRFKRDVFHYRDRVRKIAANYRNHEGLLSDQPVGDSRSQKNDGEYSKLSLSKNLLRNADKYEDIQEKFRGEGPENNTFPESLIVTADNRCRFGARWYGGGLRCYCDVSGSVTCGEPSLVASKIDGFTLQHSNCKHGDVTEEKDSCRVCSCQKDGLMMCKRDPSCKLPRLIKEKNFQIIQNRNIEDETEELKEKINIVKAKKEIVKNRKACRAKARWREGCKRCICGPDGGKICTSRMCLKAAQFKPAYFSSQPLLVKDHNKASPPWLGKPLIRPPPLPENFLRRTGPVVPVRPLHPVGENCEDGRFKVGDKYWVKCNLCTCTIAGPMCTAKSCH